MKKRFNDPNSLKNQLLSYDSGEYKNIVLAEVKKHKEEAASAEKTEQQKPAPAAATAPAAPAPSRPVNSVPAPAAGSAVRTAQTPRPSVQTTTQRPAGQATQGGFINQASKISSNSKPVVPPRQRNFDAEFEGKQKADRQSKDFDIEW